MKKSPSPNFFSAPFGAEYALRPSWNLWQRLYIRIFGLIDFAGRLRARAILKELLPLHPLSILDFGFGTGCYAFYLSRDESIQVTGLEIDPRRIADSNGILKSLGRKNLEFLRSEAQLSLRCMPPEKYDLVLVIEVLQYLPDPGETLKDLGRLLKPGGYLIAHFPSLGYLRPKELHLLDDEGIRKIFAQSNFSIIRCTRTVGGFLRLLISLYNCFTPSPLFAGILFPIFFLLSKGLSISHPKGEYRLILAQKMNRKTQP
jgi:SAM-dependent methyltransferase